MLTDFPFLTTMLKLQTGVYAATGQKMIDEIGSVYFRKGPFDFGWGTYGCRDDWENYPYVGQTYDTGMPFGVCDSVGQILDFYGSLLEDPAVPMVIEIRERIKTPEAGWRWKKAGVYIGDQSPKQEHFCDEPEIQRVLAYTIHPLSGLTPADVDKMTQAVYNSFSESDRIPWGEQTPERQEFYRDHTEKTLDMFQNRQAYHLTEGMGEHAILEDLVETYAIRTGQKPFGVSGWAGVPPDVLPRCRSFIQMFRACLEETGVTWLTPFHKSGRMLQTPVDVFGSVG